MCEKLCGLAEPRCSMLKRPSGSRQSSIPNALPVPRSSKTASRGILCLATELLRKRVLSLAARVEPSMEMGYQQRTPRVRCIDEGGARRALLVDEDHVHALANERIDEWFEILIARNEPDRVSGAKMSVREQVHCDLDVDLLLARPFTFTGQLAFEYVPAVHLPH